MKYITFLHNKHQIGGIGHSFCDYLTALIISEIFDDVKFIHNDISVTNQKRDMLVNNDNFNWNNFLNLKLGDQSNLANISSNEIGLNINKWKNIDIKILKNEIKDNKINYLTNNKRIYLFDLFYYEKINKIYKNTTQKVINKLKKNFYQKHNKLIKKKKLINVYLRCGDFEKELNTYKQHFNDIFIENIIKKIIEKKKNNIEINIISAGNKRQMMKIEEKFNKYNVNFLFNQKQDEIFYLMTQSDILIFYESSFPLTASYFCDGLIIKKKNDNYFCRNCLNKNFIFLDNYIITDKLDSSDIEKINNFL